MNAQFRKSWMLAAVLTATAGAALAEQAQSQSQAQSQPQSQAQALAQVVSPDQALAFTNQSQARLDALRNRHLDESAMAGLFGNTVVLTHPSGATIHFHFNPDKTFTISLPTGAAKPTVGAPVPTGGTYRIRNRQLLCLTWTGAAAAGPSTCLPMGPGHDISDTWVIKPGDVWTDDGGNKYAIVAGVN